jgi:hypothetical protein
LNFLREDSSVYYKLDVEEASAFVGQYLGATGRVGGDGRELVRRRPPPTPHRGQRQKRAGRQIEKRGGGIGMSFWKGGKVTQGHGEDTTVHKKTHRTLEHNLL